MNYQEKVTEKQMVLREFANKINLSKQQTVQFENSFNQVLGQIQMLEDLIKEETKNIEIEKAKE